jgi:hypothetical protein
MKYTLALAAAISSVLAAPAYCPVPAPATSAHPAPSATSSAAPAASSAAAGSSYFGVISARSGSPIHLLPLTARGNKFYLGGAGPSSYCPPSVGSACPSGNSTVFTGGDSTLSLGVIVPGGQQVYVAPDGALSYTVEHSAYIPNDSYVTGFSKTAPGGNGLGTLTFQGGFVACPAAAGQGYQVFGQVTGGKTYGSECLGFDALTCEFP